MARLIGVLGTLVFVLSLMLHGCGGGSSGAVGEQGAPEPTIDDARRLEILEELSAFRSGLPGTSDEELLALARFLDAIPEIAGVAISLDGSVWGLFTDGRVLVTADNRPPSTQIVSRDQWLAAVGPQLPGSPDSLLANAFEFTGCFDSPIPIVEGALTSKAYSVVRGAEVDDFRNAGALGILYVDSHGADLNLLPRNGSRGLVLRTPPPQEFGLWTSTDVTPARDRLYRDDLNRRRLVYYEAPTNLPDGTCDRETHYAITGPFVRQYLQFSRDSFVFINACQSNSDRLKLAVLASGASAYAGWTDNVDDDLAYHAARELFPLMTGDAGTPGFDLTDAAAELRAQGLDEDVISGARLVITTTPDTFGLLVPILLTVDESGGRLTLRGKFGSTPGRILIDGAEEPLLGGWDPLLLECGKPSGAQSVAVEVRGHLSNGLPLSGGSQDFPDGTWSGTHDTLVMRFPPSRPAGTASFVVRNAGTTSPQVGGSLYFDDTGAFGGSPLTLTGGSISISAGTLTATGMDVLGSEFFRVAFADVTLSLSPGGGLSGRVVMREAPGATTYDGATTNLILGTFQP